MKALGLDIGTTTICAALIDAESKQLLSSQTIPNDAHLTCGQPWERLQDPDRIWQLSEELLSSCLAQHQDVSSLGVTGQMHGILFLDKTGRPVSPLYTWQDQRGNLIFHEKESYSSYLTRLTGYPLSTGYGITTWFYLSENHLIPKEASVFCTIADYIAMRLAGRQKPLLHPSMAASLGLYDLKKNAFDLQALEKAGLSPGLLPRLSLAELPLGCYRTSIPVACALGDNQASFYGSVEDNDGILVNVGTGGQLSARCNTIDTASGLEYRPYLTGSYLAVGSALCSGYSYSLLKSFLEQTLKLFGSAVPEDMYSIMNEAAASIYPVAHPLKVDTRFHGTRQTPSLKASVSGLDSNNFTPKHFIAGILQGICSELYGFYQMLPEDCKNAGILIGSGNGLRKNPLLRQIFRDTFHMELRLAACTEEASYGSALFSLYCLNKLPLNEPVFFEKNRVFRVYTGGKLFDSFLQDGSRDGCYPEEWIASSVAALNEGSQDPKEGISQTAGKSLYFDELLKLYPQQMLGSKSETGILVKYLDSAIRLPFQVHPDKQFAMEHFASSHGKEECWIILDTRPGACIYYGFREGVTRAELDRALENSDTDPQAIVSLLNRYEVTAGDVIFIPARTAHAIGAGCLILEVQEPTDFTIQPERMCGSYRLSDHEMYLGLEKETALSCFSFDPVTQVKQEPDLLFCDRHIRMEALISSRQTESFRVNRIFLNSVREADRTQKLAASSFLPGCDTQGAYILNQPAAVYCILEGSGELRGKAYRKSIKRGDYFFLPAAAAGSYELMGEKLIIAECFS